MQVKVAGTLSNFRVHTSIAPQTGRSWTFTLRQNGVPTGVFCVIADAQRTCTSVATAAFVVDDFLSIEVVPLSDQGGPPNTPQSVIWRANYN